MIGTKKFPVQTDGFGELDRTRFEVRASSANTYHGDAYSSDTVRVADDPRSGDRVLRALPTLTLKFERKPTNQRLLGTRPPSLPIEDRRAQLDNRQEPKVGPRRCHKLSLPTRIDRWGVSTAIRDFLNNTEIGVLDFRSCDPTSEVLHNIFGTPESEDSFYVASDGNPYVYGPIMHLAKCLKLPRGMDRVPRWIGSLQNLDDMMLEDYQGECVEIWNPDVGRLTVSGPRLREIHVSEKTEVLCEAGVVIHRYPAS